MQEQTLFYVALTPIEGNDDLFVKVENDDDPEPEVLKLDCPPGTVITSVEVVRVVKDESRTS